MRSGQYVFYRDTLSTNPNKNKITICNRCNTLAELREAIQITKNEYGLDNYGGFEYKLSRRSLVEQNERWIVLDWFNGDQPDPEVLKEGWWVGYFTNEEIEDWDNTMPQEYLSESILRFYRRLKNVE